MNEVQKLELQELQNLEASGTLEDAMKPRFDELRAFEQAEKTALQKSKDAETLLAQKEHFRTKFEKEEADRKALETKLNEAAKGNQGAKPALGVEDYINISASLEGLDQREKERLATEHKLTGRPLTEIRKDEDFILWQTAYREKVEKEKLALKPSGTQPDSDVPKTLTQKLSGANPQEMEKLLTEAGLYKQHRPKADRSNIGGFVK